MPKKLDAIIALSPTDAPVTPELPKNLNLQAGAWEPPFVKNAERLLSQAGGPNSDLSEGQGRALAIIPSVEHATILFNDVSHQEMLSWLNQTFSLSSKSPYRDRRMAWYGLHLLGWLAAFFALPTFKPSSVKIFDEKTAPACLGWFALGPCCCCRSSKSVELSHPY